MTQKTKYGDYALLALRLALGWLYFHAGIVKVLEPGWTAAGYLKGSVGPFAGLFVSMAGNPLVDFLFKWGLVLIGLAIILGLLTRLAAFWGAVLTLLIYSTKFPPKLGLVEEHIIYIAAFIVLAATGAGKFLGLDGTVAVQGLVKRARWLRWLIA